MIKNYFKTAWRNLKRSRGFSLINIAGLTIGIVCAALILLWIEHAYQYNRQFANASNVYLVKNNQQYGNDIHTMSATNGPLAHAMSTEIPGFDKVVRIENRGGVFTVGDKNIAQSGVYADSTFFDVFPFPVVMKNGRKFLSQPNEIAISSEMAKAFFADENPIGKTILRNNKDLFTVAMVYDIPSENMAVQPLYVIPMSFAMADSNYARQWSYWGACGLRTYATLLPNASMENINKQLKGFIYKKSGSNVRHEVFLYPYTKLGLYNSFKNGIEDKSEGQIKYVKMFLLVAIIILLIACINFMNLSTARSEKRAKEIGLKKVVGATRSQLTMQFLFESLLMALSSAIIAILLLLIAVPLFSRIIDIPLKFSILNPVHIGALFSIALFCGLLAGSYPSFYLSSFNPISALKKRLSQSASGAGLIRKILVVTQFATSIILIVATIVIYTQINHVKNRDLGFDKENVLVIGTSERLVSGFNALKQNLKLAGVAKEVAIAGNPIFSMYNNGGGFKWKGGEGKEDVLITFTLMTPEYLKLMDIGIEKGREFNPNPKTDSSNVIINQSLAKLMGAEGRPGGIINRGDEGSMNIIGVTKSFVINDVYSEPPPAMFVPAAPADLKDWGGNIFIKLPKGDIQKHLKGVESEIKKIDNGFPFDYNFLDESFDQQFKSVKFVGNLSLLFGSLAIFISCLGLLGLSAFMAQQRTKEIGVRKVLGASVANISALLSKDYLKLVGIALLIAIPVAWYLMNGWLQDYNYRISLHWWIFLLAAFLSVLIALITVSTQAIKAATANPVKSLRTE